MMVMMMIGHARDDDDSYSTVINKYGVKSWESRSRSTLSLRQSSFLPFSL